MNTCKTCDFRKVCAVRRSFGEMLEECSLYASTKRASKYNNRIVKADGYTFQSQGEYEYYLVLRERERRGEIIEGSIRVHPKFVLFAQGTDGDGQLLRKLTWTADYAYRETGKGSRERIDDYKGCDTKLSELQRRVAIEQGHDVRVVWARGRKT